MRKSVFDEIMSPGNKWMVYLYVLPPHPPFYHIMYYVGISSNSLKERWSNGYGNNKELRKAVHDAGGVGNIEIYILDIVDDGETAGSLEAYYVNEVYHSLYDPDHPETCHGYNKQTGGLTGYTLCPYSKGLISRAKNVPVAQIAADEDKLIAVYASIKAVEDYIKIPWRSVSSVIHGHQNTTHGYRFADLRPFLTSHQIETIFYKEDTVELLTPLDLKALYASLPSKKEKKPAAAGDNPAVLSLPEGGNSIDNAD